MRGAPSHVLDRGGMRRTWLRGRENVAKRYLIQVAAYNLGLVMRTLLGAGTPRAAAGLRLLWLVAGDRLLLALLVGSPTAPATLAIVTVTPDHPPLSTGC
jgi:transposase